MEGCVVKNAQRRVSKKKLQRSWPIGTTPLYEETLRLKEYDVAPLHDYAEASEDIGQITAFIELRYSSTLIATS
ncbi:hypothetical protein Tco_1016384 [Tanacetum coccineum]|uniref:Uncharacterized protein n=1 Tax=Tanacetum coccineum TaxID=301880 RepID=A0ABQ5FNZ2_9ASTR